MTTFLIAHGEPYEDTEIYGAVKFKGTETELHGALEAVGSALIRDFPAMVHSTSETPYKVAIQHLDGEWRKFVLGDLVVTNVTKYYEVFGLKLVDLKYFEVDDDHKGEK